MSNIKCSSRQCALLLVGYHIFYFLNDPTELLETMLDGTAFHYLAVVGKKTVSECVGRVSRLKKLARPMFARATGRPYCASYIDLVGCL